MVEEEREKVDSKKSKRKRKWKIFARIICLLSTLFWLVVFIKILLTGYLTWIGVTVVTLFFVPVFLSSIFAFAGKKHLAKMLSFFSLGVIALLILVALILLLLPEGNQTWSPYQFDKKIASIEAKRAVPDQDNAAILYNSLFATIDMNDCPDSLFRKDRHIRDELSQHPWKSSDYPEVSQWLDSHTETLKELFSISNMEKCRWPIQIEFCDEYTVPYKPIRYCMRLLIAAGNRDLGENRPQKALEKSFCLLRIAEHIYQQTYNLDFRIGFRSELAGLQIIRNSLISSEVSQEDLDQISDRLPVTSNTWYRDVSMLLEFEELRYAHIMAQVYEINEQGKVRFATSLRFLSTDKHELRNTGKMRKLLRLYWSMNMPLNPQGVWDIADKESARLAQFLKPGPAMGIAQNDDEVFPSFFDFITKIFSNFARCFAQEMCFDKFLYISFAERYTEQITQRRGTWLILGLRKYKNEHGRWPTSLELVSDYAQDEAFLDTTCNDAFVYALDGDSFKLYGKGLNGIDEEGRDGYIRDLKRAEDDITIWPLNLKGDKN